MDQLHRLGKRELICLLLFTCNCVVSVWRGFLFLWVLGMGYVILIIIVALPEPSINYFRAIADKCARKHVCGHFCGMKGNNAYVAKGHVLF